MSFRKAVAMLLSILLVLGSLAGCSSEATVKTISEKDKYKDLQPPKTGPVGEWNIPISEINPLGFQYLYSSTDYALGTL